MLSADGTMCVYQGGGNDGGMPPVVDASCPDQGVPLVCGPNEVAMGGKCIVQSTICGKNLMMDNNGICQLTASACTAMGSVFDSMTNTCTNPPQGTPVMANNFIHGYQHIFYNVPDGGVPNLDAGTGTDKCFVYGNFNTEFAYGTAAPPVNGQMVPPDNTPIMNKTCTQQLGAFQVQARYPVGPLTPTPTAMDITGMKKLTIKDWNNCSGTVHWYLQMVNGNKMYKQVVDVANCVPDTLYTVWIFWTPDGTRANSNIAGPAGGIPNSFVTDDNGVGHWERLLDPKVWFASGQPLPYAGAHVAPPKIPDIVMNPMASAITVVLYHSNQQSNGNPGFCESIDNTKPYDPNTNPCANPQPVVVNLGKSGIDSHHQLLDEPGVPLKNLQP